MISVTKQFTFDAAHFIPNHQGKCKNLHGHTYKVEVEIASDVCFLKDWMVVDFGNIKTVMDPILERLDHTCLNDIFKDIPPTAEALCMFIAEGFPKELHLTRVRVWETPTSYAEWRKDDRLL